MLSIIKLHIPKSIAQVFQAISPSLHIIASSLVLNLCDSKTILRIQVTLALEVSLQLCSFVCKHELQDAVRFVGY
jgi:hypothetical protein